MGGKAGGRPREQGRRPACPDGHDGTVWFHGYRTRDDSLYARPRYRCVHPVCDASCRTDCARPHSHARSCPRKCDGSHTFTGPEQARTHRHPDGLWCRECDRSRSKRDGTPVANDWDFEARLIADALIAVGSGSSFREAAEGMRLAARRVRHDAQGIPYTSREGETVARYLDHFGPTLVGLSEHGAWPEVLVLDARPLRRREASSDDPFAFEQSGNGALLFALGYTSPVERRQRRRRDDEGDLEPERPGRPKRLPHLWRVAVAGGYDRWSWLDFLSALPGTPRWIVVDGDSAVRFAIRRRWGTGPGSPVVFSCEGHLMNRFRERARAEDGMPGVLVDRLWPENRRGSANRVPAPLWSQNDYRRFLDGLLAIPPDKRKNATAWVLAHDETIRRQFRLRDEHRGMPRGIGAVEASIGTVERWIGERRRTFQNVRRLDIVLGLMRAQIAGHADRAAYSRAIRDELERCGGRPRVDWREHHAPWGSHKGLFALSDTAQRQVEAERPAYLVAAQAGTVARKVAEANLYHLLAGYDPLVLTDAPTPSVVVEGRRVSDFPLIAREWDPDNDGDPASTDAGSSRVVGWVCSLDPTHKWRVAVENRTRRLTGCGAARGRAAAKHRRAAPTLADIRRDWGPLDHAETTGDAEVADEDLVGVAV